MTREQLRSRYLAAMNRHWRTSIDRSGPTPALLDELAGIAEEHAVQHAGKVTARKELRSEAATTLRDDYSAADTPPVAAEGTEGHDSARTRTRTRRNTP